MFTVRNSRTGKENIKRERERRDDNFTWKTLSQNEGKNHGTITETLLLI